MLLRMLYATSFISALICGNVHDCEAVR